MSSKLLASKRVNRNNFFSGRVIMSGKKVNTAKEKSSHAPQKDKNLLTRRSFIGTAAGMGAMGLLAGGAKKPKEKESKMPIWSGDLKTTAKQAPRIPRTSKPNGLNMIVIIADTWRADHLGCYGSTRIKTPYLDKFAKESVLFADASAEGLPTIPCRRVYHTGKSVLPESRWEPLSRDDVTFAEILQKHGVTTGFIVDTYHHFKPVDRRWIGGKVGPKKSLTRKSTCPLIYGTGAMTEICANT
jgi:hypothetical protein